MSESTGNPASLVASEGLGAVSPFLHDRGTAVLCSQDYYDKFTVGNVKTQSVAEILGGETMARLRRRTYGVEEAPEDFLCRRCEFAIRG